MKASEIIKILEAEIARKGDREVFFHGAYGAVEQTFEVMTDDNFSRSMRQWTAAADDPRMIHIWTDICTG